MIIPFIYGKKMFQTTNQSNVERILLGFKYVICDHSMDITRKNGAEKPV